MRTTSDSVSKDDDDAGDNNNEDGRSEDNDAVECHSGSCVGDDCCKSTQNIVPAHLLAASSTTPTNPYGKPSSSLLALAARHVELQQTSINKKAPGKRGKDKKQRKRKKKTAKARINTKLKKDMDASKDCRRLTSFFKQQSDNDEEEMSANASGSDTDSSNGEENEGNEDDQFYNIEVNDDDDVFTFTETVKSCKRINIEANLDIDEKEENGLETDDNDNNHDDDDDDDDDDTQKRQSTSSEEEGIQQKYLRAVHDRLKYELSPKFPGFKQKWLLKHLKRNGWWIQKEQAPLIAKELGLERHHAVYYRSIFWWLPEERWEGDIMPVCPTCKSSKCVSTKGFNSNHIGRLIIGSHENYYILTRRYKCWSCEEIYRELVKTEEKEAYENGRETEIVKYKFNFMGWDADSLPLTANGRGDEFPALLSWRAGLDKKLIDMMRSFYNIGTRPETFATTVLEWHSQEYFKSWLRYERDHKFYLDIERRKGATNPERWPMFSEFDDKANWNGKVPTGPYFAFMYKKNAASLEDHFAREVKKRGANSFATDVSYKVNKHLAMHKGKPIFKGYVTITNEFGEVRIQHHVLSDSHEQMKPPLEAYRNTSTAFGFAHPTTIYTDNPMRDRIFFLGEFESLRNEQARLDSTVVQPTATGGIPPYPYDTGTPLLKIVTTVKETDIAVPAMLQLMNKECGLAVDCEWKVEHNSAGRPVKTHKIALLQFAYCNANDNDAIHYLFVRTHRTSQLSKSLLSLLSDNSFNIVGVNVSADLKKVQRDFGISADQALRKRKPETIINLGLYARRRDVVQDGSVGLQYLAKTVLNYHIDKNDEVIFSNWNSDRLSPEQTKYALIDVAAPLEMYNKLRLLPDLNSRLTMDDVVEDMMVDVVPRNGSPLCMATRGATGRVLNQNAVCCSPNGVVQKKVKAGTGMVLIQLVELHSPDMLVPHYTKVGIGKRKDKATLADFLLGQTLGQIVVPVQMLKVHVDSPSIRHTPTAAANVAAGITLPATTQNALPTIEENEMDDEVEADDEFEENENCDDQYDSVQEAMDSIEELSSLDIEFLRSAIIEGEETGNGGRIPLQCDKLDPPPKPCDIIDKFSVVRGDLYHAMKRAQGPMDHEATKSFAVAIKNAFFIWNDDKMLQLEMKMMGTGMNKEEIENKKYFNSKVFHDCVERVVPPPSILYWRVRAVYVLYGTMIDSSTGKPFFNDRAWKSANGVLKEIRLGLYSDPPLFLPYTNRLKGDGSVMKNQYGMDMIECSRGTNRTEAYHKGLSVTFDNWHTGVEMTFYLLGEKRHRHNHICSERRRPGFPRLGMYDTWIIDQIQNLVLGNHDTVVYEDMSNASDYKETAESFDTTAIHDSDLHQALVNHWDTKIKKESVKLTNDHKHLCKKMGIPLPFLPFGTMEERILFNTLVLSKNFPSMSKEDEAALEWIKHVDGHKVFPKWPAHIRQYLRTFEKNRRVQEHMRTAKEGRDLLNELNAVIQQPSATVFAANIQDPPRMPVIPPQAMHNNPHVIVGGTAVGVLPSTSIGQKRKQRVRGQDRNVRAPRSCGRCKKNGGEFSLICPGRCGRTTCTYFDEDGKQKGVQE